MKASSRILVFVASALLLGVYFLPVWSISLEAPQYPEGLGLQVWLHTIGGQEPGDLRKINQLNHYIGMKQIKPEEMLEMRIMPLVLGFLAGFGLLTALLGRRKLHLAWLGLFGICAIMGFADFFYWAYDYGHDLDPTAPIKVPGMSYQPPLIGTKKLLNFTAHSWPAPGGVLSLLAFLLGTTAYALGHKGIRRRLRGLRTAFAVALAAVLGCSSGPRAIAFGVDTCAHCRMVVEDPRFAAQLVTTTGKVLTFDAIECAARLLSEKVIAEEKVKAVYVAEYGGAHGFVDAASAVFLHDPAIKSPMGGSLAAFRLSEDARPGPEGKLLAWSQVQALQQVFNVSAHEHHHGSLH